MTSPTRTPPTQEQLDRYRWYHQFSFPNGAKTRPTVDCPDVWEHIEATLLDVRYYGGREVLDCGSRDCYWAIQACRQSAKHVTAIDITLNPGVAELILPYYDYPITQLAMNVMDIADGPIFINAFDTIFCAGLLYHLRYPFAALAELAKVLRPGGLLLIETALLDKPEVADMAMLWCPVHESPYEATSCTFFNTRGLRVTMESLGFEELLSAPMKRKLHNPPGMDRGTFVYRKARQNEYLRTYWDATASQERLDALLQQERAA